MTRGLSRYRNYLGSQQLPCRLPASAPLATRYLQHLLLLGRLSTATLPANSVILGLTLTLLYRTGYNIIFGGYSLLFPDLLTLLYWTGYSILRGGYYSLFPMLYTLHTLSNPNVCLHAHTGLWIPAF